MSAWAWFGLGLVALLLLVTIYDLLQKQHAILRNFPIIGHFRYFLEAVGPELRQYIVTSNNEERPFTRDQRRWVYSSAKLQNNLFGFGTDNDLERAEGYVILKHATFPWVAPRDVDRHEHAPLPCAKVLGASRGRAKAFRPRSVVNVSAMSFGSLSSAATRAINRGCALAGCLHDTGEGGIAPHHGQGGELIWQLGTGYFGARDARGAFSMERFVETVQANDVRAIEVKLSQGAKPGKGGILPAAKVSREIARIRGVPEGEDCVSPPGHSEFSDADELLDFVETLADATGLPVGIKSAVGETQFWLDLATQVEAGGRCVDFIAIDGGEGGTGAAPLAYADHVSLPFKVGMARVFRIFAERGLTDRIVWAGSGRLGFPEEALFAFALGCDLVHVAREPMMAIGCIQAQRCHTGHCPTGVATQTPWLERGLDPTSKAVRLSNYIKTLRSEMSHLAWSCGRPHPALVTSEQLELLGGRFEAETVGVHFGYEPEWGLPSIRDREEITRIMSDRSALDEAAGPWATSA